MRNFRDNPGACAGCRGATNRLDPLASANRGRGPHTIGRRHDASRRGTGCFTPSCVTDHAPARPPSRAVALGKRPVAVASGGARRQAACAHPLNAALRKHNCISGLPDPSQRHSPVPASALAASHDRSATPPGPDSLGLAGEGERSRGPATRPRQFAGRGSGQPARRPPGPGPTLARRPPS